VVSASNAVVDCVSVVRSVVWSMVLFYWFCAFDLLVANDTIQDKPTSQKQVKTPLYV
jgi:hypothetical protein